MIRTIRPLDEVAAEQVEFSFTDVRGTIVVFRSSITALVVGMLLVVQKVPVRLSAKHRRALPAIGVLIAVQSLCLYSAVARLPVALALLAFNTFPIWTAAWAFGVYRRRPERRVLLAMPAILLGLVLALDVFGAASGLDLATQWGRIGSGVGFAVGGAMVFGLALALTQHEVAELDGRLRTAVTMALVGLLALGGVAWQGGFHWPQAIAGWWGLAALTLLYGTGITMMFTLLPKLGVVGNSPIMNVEPVAALVMAWGVLDQRVAPVQILGSLLVVGAVMALGLRRQRG